MTTLRRGALQTERANEQALLLAGLAAVAVVELVILRTFTRTAIHIPDLEALAGPYQVIAAVGRYAYFVSVALLLLSLPILVRASWSVGTGAARAAGGALVMFATVAAASRAGIGTELALDAATLAIVALVAAAAVVAARGSLPRLPIVFFALAFVLSGSHTALQAAAQAGIGAVDARVLLTGAELAGVSFALAAPLFARPIGRAPLVAGAIAAVVTFAMLLGSGSTVRILLLWNEGLSGTFPAVVYAAAAGALTMSLGALLRYRDVRTATALVLILAGGIGLHNTYQTGLVVVGLALLALVGDTSGQRLGERDSPGL